ncbi:sensor histidine kinase [Paracoccus laeviglucosivorans]|uniref:histidine kinase n=1 Tax=Paracoccus laeviglucosivorans TaxID=1197861 RepID=A0A521EB95_9RHOB|nr:sensor histidine kinase [Paracoccus laeviglucosivorans]SMO81208.1 two-component system, OmpR family, sensor histidine kinase TctE [Paracoccus laeviglucosivorans]
MTRARLSLRATVALWMVPTILFSFGSSWWLTQVNVRELANSAYDRTLDGALRAIEDNISTKSGGLGVELPYALFASLQATSAGTVYFRVSSQDGLVQIGDVALPPAPKLATGVPLFYNAEYLDQNVRIGALRTTLAAPLYGAAQAQDVVIEVAETAASRQAFLDRIGDAAFWRDVVTTFLGLALMMLGIGFALRPLERLRQRFDSRGAEDLSPLDESQLPAEVRPLVQSFNALLLRHAALAGAQRRFLDDASHQLRTPISVLRMQLDYALQTDDPTERRATLEAMRPVIERSTRTTSQMLALARADATTTGQGDPVDPARILSEVARLHLQSARRKGLLMDLDLPELSPTLIGHETLIYEALSNLLDNAIRHSPKGGTIRLALSLDPDGLAIDISDDGPGMSREGLARLGERFRTEGGNGLGLALVQSVAKAHGGRLSARNRDDGGLQVTLKLPQAN